MFLGSRSHSSSSPAVASQPRIHSSIAPSARSHVLIVNYYERNFFFAEVISENFPPRNICASRLVARPRNNRQLRYLTLRIRNGWFIKLMTCQLRLPILLAILCKPLPLSKEGCRILLVITLHELTANPHKYLTPSHLSRYTRHTMPHCSIWKY